MEGVDTEPERHVVDKKNNSYGEFFFTTMDSSCCMLNGRHNIDNDFPCISTRGRSVVDYCFVQHDQIEHFSQMNVMAMYDLLQQAFLPGVVDPSQSVPDHSLLCWQIKLVSSVIGTSNENVGSLPKVTITKHNTDNLPDDWLRSPKFVQQVEDCITRLAEQNNLDQEYDRFCNRVLTEIDDRLPSRNNGWSKETIQGPCTPKTMVE